MARLKISARPCQLLSGLVLASFSVAAEPQSDLIWRQSAPTTGSWKNHEQLVMENDRISVTILPDIGGRVIRYVDRTTGINHLHEGNGSSADRAGGIWDKEGVWPTTNISNHSFSARVRNYPDRLEALLEADLGNLQVTRKYTLTSHSTRLRIETTYRNSGALAIRYLVAQVFQLAPGGTAGREDYLLYPDGDSLVKKAFGSDSWEQPPAGSPTWWMLSDAGRRESLLLTFEPNPGIAERSFEWEKGFISLQLHTRRHLAQPGEVLSLRSDIRLIRSGSELAQVCGSDCLLPEAQRAGMVHGLTPLVEAAPNLLRDAGDRLLNTRWGIVSLSVDQRVVRRPAPLDAEIRWSCSGTHGRPPEVRLQLDDVRGGEVASQTCQPGAVGTSTHRFPSIGLDNGMHRVRLRFETSDARSLEIPFAAVDEQALASRIEHIQEASAESARRARSSGNPARIAGAASCEMRAEDARRKFTLGPEFEEWGNSTHGTDVNRLPLRMSPKTRPGDVSYVLRVLDEAEACVKEIAAGRDPLRDRRGLLQKAFRSRIDSSLQPYTVYVPATYDGKTPRPLLVLLHGSGGDQWEIPQAAANLDGRSVFAGALEQDRIESNFLMCAPLARGPSGYVHIAEVDILQMLDEVQRDYLVDADRIYVLGWSMGGAGAFLMASRFPDRFAAIMPVAGSADPSLIENARYVPCWNYHGLGDTVVSPGYLRVVEAAYQALGLPYHDGFLERPFVWSPWADHWVGYRMMGSLDEIEKILGSYRRVVSPKEITLITPELRHNESYWVRIDAFESYAEPARLVARSADNSVEITSSNVRAFTLLMSRAPVDRNRAIRVTHNGRLLFEGRTGTELPLGERTAGKGPHKTHGLSGPLSDVYYEPFLIVAPPAEATGAAAATARKEAEALRTEGLFGNRFFGVPIKSDPEITVEDIRKYHLIVLGAGGSSAFLNRIMDRLPVRIEGNAVVAGDRRFSGEDVGFRLIYPNPLNPRRYVVVCAGVSARALEGLGSIPAPNYGWLSRVTEPDVLITDRRTRGPFKRYLAAYTFDNDWNLEGPGAVVGRFDADLSVAGIECSWGDFRADAIREATGADVALVEVDDHLYPLELAAGTVSRTDLVKANNWAHVYTLAATGAQVGDALEHSLQRWLEGTREAGWYLATVRPLAVSGFSYAFRKDRPGGERVKVDGLEPGRTYRVAITEHVLSQATDAEAGFGYLGWLPTVRREEFNEIEAQSRYLNKRGHVRPPRDMRIGSIGDRLLNLEITLPW